MDLVKDVLVHGMPILQIAHEEMIRTAFQKNLVIVRFMQCTGA